MYHLIEDVIMEQVNSKINFVEERDSDAEH